MIVISHKTVACCWPKQQKANIYEIFFIKKKKSVKPNSYLSNIIYSDNKYPFSPILRLSTWNKMTDPLPTQTSQCYHTFKIIMIWRTTERAYGKIIQMINSFRGVWRINTYIKITYTVKAKHYVKYSVDFIILWANLALCTYNFKFVSSQKIKGIHIS